MSVVKYVTPERLNQIKIDVQNDWGQCSADRCIGGAIARSLGLDSTEMYGDPPEPYQNFITEFRDLAEIDFPVIDSINIAHWNDRVGYADVIAAIERVEAKIK